ncbi:MAG: hypothetical protein ACREJC_19365 [Tepidisphaeraceae bacterium]
MRLELCTSFLLFATCAASAPPTSQPTTEILFRVEKLGCTLVEGVGCGHLLAPMLARIDGIEGVLRTYSNWTGSVLRVSVAPGYDAPAVAERVRKFLTDEQQNPARIETEEAAATLRDQKWWDVVRIVELTSYEYRTFAMRQLIEFADREKLDAATRTKLTALVDEVWDKSGEGLGPPSPQADDYAQYWHNRRQRLIELFVERAASLLKPEQVEKLRREYSPRSG